ncbi:hypothetical protein VNO77_30236 [Canavalia gladiata]|uniref:Uncharacterized protein n=1 Tax=Canavalia gladiata TaxID=3824 RepID=A0AAN9KQ40_CANGL
MLISHDARNAVENQKHDPKGDSRDSIFFYNVLHPPHIHRTGKFDKCFDSGDSKADSTVNESAIVDAGSSSSGPGNTSNSIPASVGQLLSKVAPVTAAVG